jgi:hypothetical protein
MIRGWPGPKFLETPSQPIAGPHVKDRPHDVKETILLPRKCLSASEKHLCPQAIHKEKGYKTQSPP